MENVYDIAEQYDMEDRLAELVDVDVERLALKFNLRLEEAEELQSLASILQDARD